MEQLLQDPRYDSREISKSAGTSLFIVLLFALGIGLKASVFSLLNAVLLRKLPVRNPQEFGRLDPRLPFHEIRTVSAEVEASLWAERILARLSVTFLVKSIFMPGWGPL